MLFIVMADREAFSDLIKKHREIYIQTHDFPDMDAVASAFGLKYIIENFNVRALLVYEGDIQRNSLRTIIREFSVPIYHVSHYSLKAGDKIIIVDGCKGNRNVTDLTGDEIGVIDHHEVESPEHVAYCDIRPEYGACSSLIYFYFRKLGLEIPRNVATALLAGLQVDTALLTRGVAREDVIAYSSLYPLSDIAFVNSLLRNKIQVKDLTFYRKAMERVRVRDRYAFCCFPEGCNQNLLGIIGDFFLSLSEVDFVCLCADNGGSINFSLRSEVPYWNAARVIQEVLEGIGFGGGHGEMAGGIIQDRARFDPQAVYAKLQKVLAEYRKS